jgi:hypothetical protein
MFVAVMAGCSQESGGNQPPTSSSSEAPAGEPMTMSHEGHDHEAGHEMGQMGSMTHDESTPSKYADALAKLSAADRELAEKQKICPVSGEPLGAMGTPYKVTLKDREVFLCCSGCEARIKENPDEYLAKLDQ